jgi:hypothetical protein
MLMSIQQLTLLADREFQKGLIGSTGRDRFRHWHASSTVLRAYKA